MKCHLGELSLSCASKEGVRKVGWVGAGEQWKIFQNERIDWRKSWEEECWQSLKRGEDTYLDGM